MDAVEPREHGKRRRNCFAMAGHESRADADSCSFQPWDETSIHMAVLHDDGTVTNEVTVKEGSGKQVFHECISGL